MFPLWLSCSTNHTRYGYYLYACLRCPNHKFLRSGFISDSAILCQTHGSFSINVEWIHEKITSTPSVAHCIFPSLIFSACPVLYSYGILSRIHIKFFEENSSRNSGRMSVVSESLRKGEELSECALDSTGWTARQNLSPSLPTWPLCPSYNLWWLQQIPLFMR